MTYKISNIIKSVRVALDENMQSSTLSDLGDIETLALDEIIKSNIEEGVRNVHKQAPYYMLEGGHNFGDAIYWKELESGWVLLPEDFMRLVVFEMDDWEQAVYAAISVISPEYKKQRSRFKGIRGTSQNPVCVLSVRPEGQVLEFYSCKSTEAQVRRAVYLPYPKIDEDGGIDICERCYPAVIYEIASLTLLTYGERERAKIMSEMAQTNLV